MRRSVVAVVVVSVVVAVLAGCSSVPAPVPSATRSEQTKRLETTAECLTQHGWKARVTWNHSIHMTVPNKQRSAVNTAMNSCYKKAQSEFPLPTFDLAEEKVEYRKELANRECFVKLGYSMPEPPSLQTYLDTFKSDRWLAFSAVPVGPEASYKKALETCWPPYWSE